MPLISEIASISNFERNRLGIGYIFYRKRNFDFEMSYDFLLTPNDSEFRKGRWILALSFHVLPR